MVTDFDDGSAFGHASSLWHPHLGYVDVHRHFPGIGLPAEEAFDLLWADRIHVDIAHRPCAVPSVPAHRLLLLLHAARGGRPSDRWSAWDGLDAEERRAVRALVTVFEAQVAFAAATGSLDRYANAPDHDLWALYSSGAPVDRWAEWAARMKAAPTVSARVGVLRSLVRVNRGHLRMRLGHEPSRRELASAAVRRVRAGIHGLWRWGR